MQREPHPRPLDRRFDDNMCRDELETRVDGLLNQLDDMLGGLEASRQETTGKETHEAAPSKCVSMTLHSDSLFFSILTQIEKVHYYADPSWTDAFAHNG